MRIPQTSAVSFQLHDRPCTVTYLHQDGHWTIAGKYHPLWVIHRTTCVISYGDQTATGDVHCSAKDRYDSEKGKRDARKIAVNQLFPDQQARTEFYQHYFAAVAQDRDRRRAVFEARRAEAAPTILATAERLVQDLRSYTQQKGTR